jgi:hypothetical protein
MKKLLLSLAAVILTLSHLAAQESTFDKGDKVLNLGIGFGSTYWGGFGYSGLVPPLSASFEVAILDELIQGKGSVGVGGYVGFSSYKWADYYRYSNFIIGPRGTFHYPLVDNLDTYAGLVIGYRIHTSTWVGSGTEIGDNASGGPISSGFIGARYYFSDYFAAMAELGYGIAYLTLGVALKF